VCFIVYIVLAYVKKYDIMRVGNKPILNFTQKLIMSTRSVIGIINDDNSVNSVYCHYDGYPTYTGYFLKKFFDTTEKVNNLISSGDISQLASKSNWENVQYPMINKKQVLKTLYYIDRPKSEFINERWENIKPQKHKGVLEFFQRDCCDEFKYLFLPSGNWNYNNKGVWKCYDTTTPTKHPSVQIPDTSRFYNSDKQMFVYGFSKVSRIKELAQ